MKLIAPILAELEQEAKTTRKMLELLPEDKLKWKPHEKSMTLGRLAAHIAEIPSWVDAFVQQDELVLGAVEYEPPMATSVSETLETFDKNLAYALEKLKPLSDDQLSANWRLKKEEEVIHEMPRLAVVRTWLLSHIIHHRGQLSVYLRLNDVPLPQVYGPTADAEMSRT
ncbi:MAG: DinB family protein [bacterium]